MHLTELSRWWFESLEPTHSYRTRLLYLEAVARLAGWLEGRTTPDGRDAETCIPDRATLTRYFAAFRKATSIRTGRQVSPGYVNQHWRSLQQFYKFLEAEELITENPFSKLRQPPVPESPVPVFTDQER